MARGTVTSRALNDRVSARCSCGRSLADIITGYQRHASLAEASTIPAEWYTDPRVLDLERRTVFSRAWQPAVG